MDRKYLLRQLAAVLCVFIIIIITIIIIIIIKEANHAGRYIPNIILNLHPLVQSRIRAPRRAAPSQTEVTYLNCSDLSITSKKWLHGELWCASI